jgi:hypothetical protein
MYKEENYREAGLKTKRKLFEQKHIGLDAMKALLEPNTLSE